MDGLHKALQQIIAQQAFQLRLIPIGKSGQDHFKSRGCTLHEFFFIKVPVSTAQSFQPAS